MYIFICTGAEKTVTAKLAAEQIMICKCSVKRPHIDLQHFIVVATHEQDIWQLLRLHKWLLRAPNDYNVKHSLISSG